MNKKQWNITYDKLWNVKKIWSPLSYWKAEWDVWRIHSNSVVSVAVHNSVPSKHIDFSTTIVLHRIFLRNNTSAVLFDVLRTFSAVRCGIVNVRHCIIVTSFCEWTEHNSRAEWNTRHSYNVYILQQKKLIQHRSVILPSTKQCLQQYVYNSEASADCSRLLLVKSYLRQIYYYLFSLVSTLLCFW